MNKKRGRIEDEVYDFDSSAPVPTQEEEFHFMPTPGLSQ